MLVLQLVLSLTVAFAQVIKPTLPSKDSFYEAPSNVSDYDVGDIIDYRQAPYKLRSLYTEMDVKEAWQLLVRSEDSRGDPIAMVTTVLVPYDPNPSRVVSYQFAQDSATMDCAPSYHIARGASMGTLVQQSETLLVSGILAKGWYAVLPDYEGPDGAFTSGYQAGRAGLDSLKAALNSTEITGISSDAKTALWGFSGGSFASTWMASLQPEYAPELSDNLVGAALGGWVTNWTDVLAASEGRWFAGLVPNILNGMIKADPDLKEIFDAEVKEEYQKRLYGGADDCIFTAGVKYILKSFFEGENPWFKSGYDFFDIPEIQAYAEKNVIGVHKETPRPEIPLFVYHGVPDEIVPHAASYNAFKQFCEWGIKSLEYAESTTTGHILEAIQGAGAALAWIENRFNGEAPVDGCNHTVRTSNVLYPGADAQFHQLLRTIPVALTGQEVGESTRNITDSTMFTRIVQNTVGGILGLVGPIPWKRDLTGVPDELAEMWQS
ncbi:uncharacterized protein CXQ87_003552 [Candidozyma duobushaemuli]|uniref:Triacylglycerol lipase n=2 Tax=Candidozyma TaxID=3303203 RepID=A0ABX8I6I1_9ASCO|nr:uncharacterized protein CXQ87_003552 [[Candida] duobushaemulonis]PVH15706.1 hypothetical protein CXQ87_003552 [[Candida] duobushaemulonis]QWU88891.1 hypothetical protein CA3LBN_003199 [[Candida] haemuloni]